VMMTGNTTGLASNINPTDVLDNRFLLRGNRWSPIHRTPAFPSFPISVHFLASFSGVFPSLAGASVSSCWIGNQAMRLTFEKPLTVATSLIDPFDPGGRGAVSSRRSLFRYLNRPQAKTSALPLLSPVYPPEGLPLGGYTQTII